MSGQGRGLKKAVRVDVDLGADAGGPGHGFEPAAQDPLHVDLATGLQQQALADRPDGDPAKGIARINRFVKASLAQRTDEGAADDGLEIGVCRVEADWDLITYAGARFSLWNVSEGAVQEIKGDRTGIGYRAVPRDLELTNHTIEATPGASFYMFSDGITDQIGGPKQRSFGKKRLAKFFEDHYDRPMKEQKLRILDAFRHYQGEQLRCDDVTVVGFRPSS